MDRTSGFQSGNPGSIPGSAAMNSKYQEALKLRFQGKSYGEIKQLIGVPKSTLSSWFKNLEFPLTIQKILEEKGRITREPLMEFNRRRTEIIKDENKKIERHSFKDIHLLSRYELTLIGVALYWAEGYKIEKQKTTAQICFANSDAYMVALFLRFLREIIEIPEEKLKVSAHIYPNINKESAIDFWSKITNIPKARFRATQQISKASKGKRSWNSLPFGTLKLTIHGRQYCYRVKGWINALKNQSGLK